MQRAAAWLAIALVACRDEPRPPPPPPPAPTCAPAPSPARGEATHYRADGTGKCSFDASPDELVAAISSAAFAGAAWCGACLVVIGPDATEIVVRVVDSCPACKPGDLDLSEAAFALLAPLTRGRIPITWLPVPCDVEGPLAFRFKERSNPSWTGIQLRNHRYPIARLEARRGDGSYTPLPRADYNYFVGSALGPGPYTLRITDARGQQLEEQGIALGDGELRPGRAQLPLCR